MASIPFYILKSVRPRQWLKNLAVYAALLFSGMLFEPTYFAKVSLAFGLFCGLSSVVYLLNDIADKTQDSKHPFKKKRPIASGALPERIAWLTALGLLSGVLWIAWQVSFFLFSLSLLYLLLNMTYTAQLKRVPIVDVLTIAAGYVIRVYAGALVVDVRLNSWFLLTVISLALFLAVGKRQSERTLLSGYGNLQGHRVTLAAYSQRLLDIYTGMFANATWLTYALFAFQYQFLSNDFELPEILDDIPLTFSASKWLMATVPVVIYGVMRYLQLVYEHNQGESPERVITTDIPLITTVLLWLGMTIFILYALA